MCAVRFALLYFSGSLEPHCWDLMLYRQALYHGIHHRIISEGLWKGGLCEASWTWSCTSLNSWGFLIFSRYSLTLPPRSYWVFLNKFWTCVLEKSQFCAHSGGIFVGKNNKWTFV